MKDYNSGRNYDSGEEEDWTLDLENIIEEQTRHQAGMDGGTSSARSGAGRGGGRSRAGGSGNTVRSEKAGGSGAGASNAGSGTRGRASAGVSNPGSGTHGKGAVGSTSSGRGQRSRAGSVRQSMDPDDAVLFEELEEEPDGAYEDPAGAQGDPFRTYEDSDSAYDYEDSMGAYGTPGRRAGTERGEEASRGKMSRKERRAARQEEEEYQEFLEYKRTKGKVQHKRKHRLLRRIAIVLVVIILLIYALGTIALRLLGIQTTLTGIGAFNEGVSSNAAMSGYTNIALFGVDSRDEDLGEGNRTDVMIIASINNKTGDINLVSVYRDTYLDIGDDDYQKANAAYAYGGAEQAITMLNTNLDLNITDYVTIGFAGVADLIDTVGGVEIEVTSDEISHLNNYQTTMAEELGMTYVEVTSTGLQTLNGLQAVAYCRIRFTDGGDFTRTERQREVLTQAFSKLTSSGPLTILKAAADLSDEIETSLSLPEIAVLAVKAFTYDIADTSGFPSDDMVTTGYIGDASCVIPITLSSNVVWLHEYLFGDEDYTVSSTVSEISAYISAVTGYY